VTVAARANPGAKVGGARAARSSGSSPIDGRELRTQGRRTMAALLDAGMRVLAERGYHAARVDDIVRAAEVSHGTFYLYFSNKEDLFRALAVQCAEEMTELASSLGPVTADDDGVDELRRWLADFIATYLLEAGIRRRDTALEAAALLAMFERSTYFVTSRRLGFDDAEVADTLAQVAHRGFFGPRGR
jgi:AcrR family transcriptional regulator